MHPVTAHGYNLGLLSADTLATLILSAHEQGKDIGSPSLLGRYNLRHQQHTRPLYHGTNAIVSLFTDTRPAVQQLRNLALKFGNNFPPVKLWIAKQLTG